MKRFASTVLSAISLCALLLFSVASARQVEGKRGITPEDYYSFQFISDPQISPDGKLVAYVVTTVDQKQNRRHSAIWMTAIDGSRTPWQFTTNPQNSNAPRWSPNGQSLAFLSARPAEVAATRVSIESPAPESRPQIWVLSMTGGEARRITTFKNGVTSFKWSPDGKRLACLSRVGPSDNRARTRIAAMFGIILTSRTSSTTQVGLMIAEAIFLSSMRITDQQNKLHLEMNGTTPIRSGRPMEPGSLSFPTALAKSMKKTATPTFG